MLGILLSVLTAASSAAPPPRPEVIALPLTSEGTPPERASEIGRVYFEWLQALQGIKIVGEAETHLLMEQLLGNQVCGIDEACLKRLLVSSRADGVLGGTITRMGQNERVFVRSVWKDGQVITSDRVLPLTGDLRQPVGDLASRAFKPGMMGAFIKLNCVLPGLEVTLPNGDLVRCPTEKEFGPFVATENALLKVSAGGVERGTYNVPLRATYSTGVKIGAQGPDILVKVDDEVKTPEGPGVPAVDPLLPVAPDTPPVVGQDPVTPQTPPAKTALGPMAWAGIAVGAGGIAIGAVGLVVGGLMGVIGAGLLASFPRYSDGRVRANAGENAAALNMRLRAVEGVAGVGAGLAGISVLAVFAAVAVGGVLVAMNFIGQGE